jgi:hypothetical protein
LITAASQRRCGFKRRSAGFALPGLPGIPASGPIDGDSAMKSTALLLNLYECIYGFAVAIVLVASGLAPRAPSPRQRHDVRWRQGGRSNVRC